MRSISATDAARAFSDLLDAVEHRGESFVILRRGEAVARLSPATRENGASLLDVLRSHPRDPAWAGELGELRSRLRVEERDWRG